VRNRLFADAMNDDEWQREHAARRKPAHKDALPKGPQAYGQA
jgi:hypothetical protein